MSLTENKIQETRSRRCRKMQQEGSTRTAAISTLQNWAKTIIHKFLSPDKWVKLRVTVKGPLFTLHEGAFTKELIQHPTKTLHHYGPRSLDWLSPYGLFILKPSPYDSTKFQSQPQCLRTYSWTDEREGTSDIGTSSFPHAVDKYQPSEPHEYMPKKRARKCRHLLLSDRTKLNVPLNRTHFGPASHSFRASITNADKNKWDGCVGQTTFVLTSLRLRQDEKN